MYSSQSLILHKLGNCGMIFTLRQLQEKVREQHSNLFTIFVDLRKAFDMVALWQVLLKVGYPVKLVNIISDLHEGNIKSHYRR